MNGWKVELRPAARRDLRLLDEGPRRAALDLLFELEEQGPELVSSIELRANPSIPRVPFHERYRMIYEISKARKQISVTRIRLRSSAYKGMKG